MKSDVQWYQIEGVCSGWRGSGRVLSPEERPTTKRTAPIHDPEQKQSASFHSDMTQRTQKQCHEYQKHLLNGSIIGLTWMRRKQNSIYRSGISLWGGLPCFWFRVGRKPTRKWNVVKAVPAKIIKKPPPQKKKKHNSNNKQREREREEEEEG